MTSCMTITHDKSYEAVFYTDAPNTSVRINNSEDFSLPSKIVLQRSRKKLNIKVIQNDSIVNNTLIKPQLHALAIFFGNAYIWNIPGMIVDVVTGRGFDYGKYFIVDSRGEIISLKRPTEYMSENMSINAFRRREKGDFNIIVAIPEVNLFHLSPKNETPRNFAGFIGLGIGAEYFYKNNKSLQLRGDAIMDFIAPVPAPFDWDESQPFESCYAFNVNLTDNFHIKRFQLGYGLNLAKNTWVYHGYYKRPPEVIDENYEPEWIDGKTKINTILGLALNTYYRFTDNFYFGIIYRPSFLKLSNPKLMYEHSISFDFVWKINL